MKIDKKTYKTNTDNHYKTKQVKTQIVIGTSLRKNSYHITRLLHKDYGKSKKWNTYTINRKGEIFQHFDDKLYSNFLGVKDGDKHSISIILENMGNLFRLDDDKFINWLNEVCDENQVIKHKWSGYNYWEKFTDEQIKSVVELCTSLCKKHKIEKKCFETHHYHKDISKFKGIVFRSNYIEDSSDINPLFNIIDFNEKLNMN